VFLVTRLKLKSSVARKERSVVVSKRGGKIFLLVSENYVVTVLEVELGELQVKL